MFKSKIYVFNGDDVSIVKMDGKAFVHEKNEKIRDVFKGFEFHDSKSVKLAVAYTFNGEFYLRDVSSQLN